MSAQKPTPGPWKPIFQMAGFDNPQHQTENSLVLWIGQENSKPVCAVVSIDNDEMEWVYRANARLIAESGTVHHETGLTPRQLAEQRAELLAALQKLAGMKAVTDAGKNARTILDAVAYATAAIAKAGAA